MEQGFSLVDQTYITATGLGLGLGGARRLMSELDISSVLGEGTTVTAVRWR